MMIKADELSQLPTKSGVYRVWHNGRVIYVGQARNLKRRWKTHHMTPLLIQRYGLDWQIDWIQITPENLDRAEAFAHREFQPELNRRNPSSLLGDPTLKVDWG
jgi:hypothetical protein